MLCISGLNAVSPACARLSSDVSLRSLFCLQYLTWHFLSQDKPKIYELAFPFQKRHGASKHESQATYSYIQSL